VLVDLINVIRRRQSTLKSDNGSAELRRTQPAFSDAFNSDVGALWTIGCLPDCRHFFNASLTFSPACLRLPCTRLVLPLARSSSSSVNSPTTSSIFPFVCWAVFFALSVVAAAVPRLGCV
jgi:hypothetical protein